MNPFKGLGNRRIERDVDEQLRFHLDQLAASYIDQGMSPSAARDRAHERFGSVELVRRECVVIGRRRRFLPRLARAILLALLIFGLGIRAATGDLYIGHLGEMLVIIALSGRIWIYLRTSRPVNQASLETIPTAID